MSQDREGANLVGINTRKVAMLTFMISGGLAAPPTSLSAPINLVFPGIGQTCDFEGVCYHHPRRNRKCA